MGLGRLLTSAQTHSVGFDADLRVTIRVSLGGGSPAAALASAERAVRSALVEQPLGRLQTGGIDPSWTPSRSPRRRWAGALEPLEVDGEEVTGPDDFCRTCGAVYRGFGDGWDGECPECADRTVASRGHGGVP